MKPSRCSIFSLFCYLFASSSASSFLLANTYSYFYLGAAMANGWLYVTSGLVAAPSSSSWISFNSTLSFSLSTSWTTADVNPIITPDITGNKMWTQNSTMWYDPISKRILWCGGLPIIPAPNPTVWGFNTNNQGVVTWNQQYVAGFGKAATGSSTFDNFTETTGALFAASPMKYFALGGYINENQDPAFAFLSGDVAVTGLVTYDFVKGVWNNASSIDYNSPYGFGVHGEAIYVPVFGQAGVLIFIGGDIPSSQIYVQGASLRSMSEIRIYDIESGKFYQQTATGATIPQPRLQLCAVGAGAADNSSYEIFIFGGALNAQFETVWPTSTTQDFSLVYILTLPAFEWIQVPGNGTQRAGHKCRVIGNRQMISIGGVTQNNYNATDPWANTLGIFDMTELTWGFNYDSGAAAYSPSQNIVDYYANSSNRYPASWSDPALKTIFETVTTSPTPTNTAITTPPPSSGSTSNTGAIAGGVVGGVAAIAIAGILTFFIRRRRNRRQIAQGVHEASTDPKYSDVPQEMDTGIVPEMGESGQVHELRVPSYTQDLPNYKHDIIWPLVQ